MTWSPCVRNSINDLKKSDFFAYADHITWTGEWHQPAQARTIYTAVSDDYHVILYFDAKEDLASSPAMVLAHAAVATGALREVSNAGFFVDIGVLRNKLPAVNLAEIPDDGSSSRGATFRGMGYDLDTPWYDNVIACGVFVPQRDVEIVLADAADCLERPIVDTDLGVFLDRCYDERDNLEPERMLLCASNGFGLAWAWIVPLKTVRGEYVRALIVGLGEPPVHALEALAYAFLRGAVQGQGDNIISAFSGRIRDRPTSAFKRTPEFEDAAARILESSQAWAEGRKARVAAELGLPWTPKEGASEPRMPKRGTPAPSCTRTDFLVDCHSEADLEE